jgi:hypothetical protein
MTAEIVNLRRFKKTKAREDRAKVANLNRERFGRSKAERASVNAEQAKIDATLDGARRDAANEAGFPVVAGHDDDDLDPGNVS